MVTSMRDNETVETEGGVSSQLEELAHVWDRVTTLSQVRESRLHDALKLVSCVTARLSQHQWVISVCVCL